MRERSDPEALPPKAMAAPDSARGVVRPLRTYHATTRQNIVGDGLEVRTYMLPSGRLVEVRTVMEMQR